MDLGTSMDSSSSEQDYVFLEGFFVEEPPEKFSCPICLSPVQREAFLIHCCGKHFCYHCIIKVAEKAKRCPMCKATPMLMFPNKERQRDIKSLRVWCPEVASSETTRCDCIWSGELRDVEKHLESAHQNRRKTGACVKSAGAGNVVKPCLTGEIYMI